jgi:hypothetical protein
LQKCHTENDLQSNVRGDMSQGCVAATVLKGLTARESVPRIRLQRSARRGASPIPWDRNGLSPAMPDDEGPTKQSERDHWLDDQVSRDDGVSTNSIASSTNATQKSKQRT